MTHDPDRTSRDPSSDGDHPAHDETRVVRTEHVGTSADHRSDDAHLTETEVARLRTLLSDGSLDDGANRFKWFMLGFLAALLALVIAAGAFLVVSDDDDDGRLNIDVPEVDVGG